MTGYAQLNKAIPASLKITDTDGYPALQFYDSSTGELRSGFLSNIANARPYARSYSIDANGNNILSTNGGNVYSNYLFPKSTITSGSKDYNIITTQNPEDISKGVAKLIYPVGSIYTTSTNSNPSSYLGGTWDIIHKLLSYKYTSTNILTLASTSTLSATTSYMYRSGDTINLSLRFTPTGVLNDTEYKIGTLNLNTLGVSGLGITRHILAIGDALEGAAIVAIDSEGAVTVQDFIGAQGKSESEAEKTAYANLTWVVNDSHKLDSACDRFIWQRTA